jgi:hypothetical protein
MPSTLKEANVAQIPGRGPIMKMELLRKKTLFLKKFIDLHLKWLQRLKIGICPKYKQPINEFAQRIGPVRPSLATLGHRRFRKLHKKRLKEWMSHPQTSELAILEITAQLTLAQQCALIRSSTLANNGNPKQL